MLLLQKIHPICATVILYNPELKLIHNILSYSHYVDKLIIVDNSEVDNTFFMQELKKIISNFEYISNGENLGIATALNIACKSAKELNYQWILTMDQDSYFCDFELYIRSCNTCITSEIAVMTPNSELNCENINMNCEILETDKTITSGSLINLNIYSLIGKFEDKLFIDEVDFEYCLRAKKNGYKVLFLKNVPLKHSLGEINQKISRKDKTKSQHNYVRRYYITRNHFYVSKLYGNEFKEYKMRTSLYQYIYRNSWKILTREDDKLKKILSIFLGFKDFLINNYGKFHYKY